MLQWLSINANWLFSGGGVVLVVAVISWLYKRFGPKDKKSNLGDKPLQAIIDAPPAPKRVNALPSPAKIVEAVASAPILLRPDVGKQFVGLKVSWTGELQSAKKRTGGLIEICISIGGSSVFVEVDPNQYPGLGVLREGHEISVTGEIAVVSSYIDLNNATIRFTV